MKPESLIFAVSGLFLGLIAGWLIGSQQASPRPPAAMPAAAQTAPAQQAGNPAPPPLDQAEVTRLTDLAEREPKNAAPRTQLGNLFFDAERFDQAIQWYESALTLDPNNPDVSTDLGVSYYYMNQPDRALAQFQRSLEIDPKHTKTMLNEGIVRAFGKQDLEGAARSWQRAAELAPDSPEGRAARRAIDSMKAAHPELNQAAAPGSN
jgi:tetratricopeptide (TPR) repeat protein